LPILNQGPKPIIQYKQYNAIPTPTLFEGCPKLQSERISKEYQRLLYSFLMDEASSHRGEALSANLEPFAKQMSPAKHVLVGVFVLARQVQYLPF
jgi:hypothetical protein